MLSGTLSSGTSSSRLSQFGLYRTIDARTEDFLKLSRKRQIRQGCICASISTIITVTIVIVILLIYEYAIAVESNLVQTRRRGAKNHSRNDNPVAIGLHRSYFGFDQDYFERMPLLVNALQDSSYIDHSTAESNDVRKSKHIKINTTNMLKQIPPIRRTSPRPFIFEYKSPTPTPFRKAYNTKTWIETYRNAQRLKNLQQIIKYLENTINAKFGDTETASTTGQVAFSGLLLEPVVKPDPNSPTIDLIMKSTQKAVISRSNHIADPLYTFKPESPGDVNLLADGFLRFSPTSAVNLLKEKMANKLPMFVPIANRKKICLNSNCEQNNDSNILFKLKNPVDAMNTNATILDKTKSYSVMLNLFPLTNTVKKYENELKSTAPVDVSSIYITTPRPQPTVQFRRKTTMPVKRISSRYSRPRVLIQNRDGKGYEHDYKKSSTNNNIDGNNQSNLILHINVYNINESISDNNVTEPTSTRNVHITDTSSSISSGVQDYHVGSSGVVPIELRTTTPSTTSTTTAYIKTPPTFTTTMTPFFDTTVTTTEIGWPTHPPEFVKFSQEDAKIPKDYRHLWRNHDRGFRYATEINRRTSSTTVEYDDEDTETSTLTIKLKNDDELNEQSTESEVPTTKIEEDEVYETTTVQTYVPLINGHYRSVTYVPRLKSDWMKVNNEMNRKRRLELSIRGFRRSTSVPYVEIKRNHTNATND